MITLQMSGQAGREASPFAPAYHGTKQRERLSALPARSPSLESPISRSRAADLHSTSAVVWIRLCRSRQPDGQNLAAAILGPDMSELGVPGFVGSVRTHLQHFVVRD